MIRPELQKKIDQAVKLLRQIPLADEMSQAFNTFKEMSEETAQRLETIYKDLMQW